MSGELVMPVGYGLIKHIWTYTGGSGTVSHHYGYKLASAGVTVAEVAEAAAGATTATGSIADDLTVMSSAWTLERCDAYLQTAGGLVGATFPIDASGSGGIDIGTANSTLLVPVRTTFLGKQFRGRQYLPNVYISQTVITPGGAIPDANWAPVRNRVLAWFEAIGDLSTVYQPHLLHTVPKVTPEDPTPEAPAPTPITAFSLNHNIATQRRRLL